MVVQFNIAPGALPISDKLKVLTEGVLCIYLEVGCDAWSGAKDNHAMVGSEPFVAGAAKNRSRSGPGVQVKQRGEDAFVGLL